ncbi:MAG: Glu/Leu/Phe/Val dehydrogenase dimerization region [Frankiales bacterium]|nr:Glu/Leu/Phe/Val dehydrogenase dimerization region [Frankiales bacterium]
MSVFDRNDDLGDAGHEQVVFCQDRASGLRAIIAIYSTALGPALGGTRFYPYASEADALTDVLRLSRAMAYKAACAGVALGGGKAVILGDPARDKSEELLRAYGRFVQSLGGRYYTACDVGTSVPDMDVMASESVFVTGRSPEAGGAGDSAVLTAYGVFQAMRAAATHTWGEPTLRGRRVAVEGVGKVGLHLVEHLLADGAAVVVSDVMPAAVERARALAPEVESASVEVLPTVDADVFAPCALGGSVDEALVSAVQSRVVCGAANNQLTSPSIAGALAARGVLFVPDYVANAGGLIQVGDEALHAGSGGFSFERAEAAASGIYDTVLEVLATAEREQTTPAAAADRIAERRMAEAESDPAGSRGLRLPGGTR